MKYLFFSLLVIFNISFPQAQAAIGCLPGQCGSHGGRGDGGGSPTSPRPLPPSRPPSSEYREVTGIGGAQIFSPGCDREDRDEAERLAQRRAYEHAVNQLHTKPKLVSKVTFTSSCGAGGGGENDLWDVEARARFSN